MRLEKIQWIWKTTTLWLENRDEQLNYFIVELSQHGFIHLRCLLFHNSKAFVFPVGALLQNTAVGPCQQHPTRGMPLNAHGCWYSKSRAQPEITINLKLYPLGCQQSKFHLTVGMHKLNSQWIYEEVITFFIKKMFKFKLLKFFSRHSYYLSLQSQFSYKTADQTMLPTL